MAHFTPEALGLQSSARERLAAAEGRLHQSAAHARSVR